VGDAIVSASDCILRVLAAKHARHFTSLGACLRCSRRSIPGKVMARLKQLNAAASLLRHYTDGWKDGLLAEVAALPAVGVTEEVGTTDTMDVVSGDEAAVGSGDSGSGCCLRCGAPPDAAVSPGEEHFFIGEEQVDAAVQSEANLQNMAVFGVDTVVEEMFVPHALFSQLVARVTQVETRVGGMSSAVGMQEGGESFTTMANELKELRARFEKVAGAGDSAERLALFEARQELGDAAAPIATADCLAFEGRVAGLEARLATGLTEMDAQVRAAMASIDELQTAVGALRVLATESGADGHAALAGVKRLGEGVPGIVEKAVEPATARLWALEKLVVGMREEHAVSCEKLQVLGKEVDICSKLAGDAWKRASHANERLVAVAGAAA